MNRELLSIDENKCKVYLLGYELELTKGEYSLLWALYDAQDYMNSDMICEKAFKNKNLSAHSITVHVSNINMKASVISGRTLIESRHLVGYKIVDKI